MPTGPTTRVFEHLRSAALLRDGAGFDDAELLGRFLDRHDDVALAALVRRHGPMVWGVCRRLLSHHDAEDAFQATFLVLVRKAASVVPRHMVGNFLYGVAHQTALQARRAAARRGAREVQVTVMPDPASAPQDQWPDLQPLLDQELSLLPDYSRAVLVLCDLEGRTRKEVARQLRVPEGTVAGRLARARAMLAKRLARRGVTLSATALAAVLAQNVASAGVSPALVSSAIRAAALVAVGQTAPTGAISAPVAALTDGVLKAMLVSKLAIKSTLALLAALAVGIGIYAATGHADPPAKAAGDKEGPTPAAAEKVVQPDDPLPAGSTMRLGTSRFRQGARIQSMAVAADGKTAFVVNGTQMLNSTRAFDLASGRSLFTLEHDEGEAVAIAPDGRTFVTKQRRQLHVRDFRTGRELRTIPFGKGDRWTEADALAFTPDGKAVATISDGTAIHLIDLASGKTIRDFPHTGWGVRAVAISPDGKRMAGGGYDSDKDNYFARLWDVATGKELRRFDHGKHGYGIRFLAFSADGKTLATGADDGRARLWDVDTGKQRMAFPAEGYRRIRGVAFAPDGKTVAVAGTSVRLYDTATGKERLRIDRVASHLHFRDDGKTLTAAVAGAIYRWDTATGKALTPEAAGDSIVAQILVTPDGRRIVTRGQGGDAHVWDGVTGKHLRAIQVRWQEGIALSPDGRYLAWAVSETVPDPRSPRKVADGSRIRLYDLAAGRLVERFPACKGDAQDVAFTADGKALVTVDRQEGTVRWWQVETGKELRRIRVISDAEKSESIHVRRAAVSPDCTMLAVAYTQGRIERGGLVPPSDVIRLWDTAKGRELRRLNGHTHFVQHMAFSPDGRLLAIADQVWDVAAGRWVTDLPARLPITAFSNDGRTLTTASFDGTIRLWEIATWTERTQLPGRRVRPTALAFTPAGHVLSGRPDTTVLAWSIRPPRVAASVPLERAWDDLAARDAGESFRSEGRFLATPADAVKLFAAKVQPPVALDPRRMRCLLADLDSDVFVTREAASQALRGLNEQAMPYLEAALKRPKSLEVRLRVERVLQHLRRVPITPEQLRQTRAVMILERIGDSASKRLLKRWAGGPAGARLTMEASAAVRRLGAVSNAKR